jgi:hypothetical protein
MKTILHNPAFIEAVKEHINDIKIRQNEIQAK